MDELDNVLAGNNEEIETLLKKALSGGGDAKSDQIKLLLSEWQRKGIATATVSYEQLLRVVLFSVRKAAAARHRKQDVPSSAREKREARQKLISSLSAVDKMIDDELKRLGDAGDASPFAPTLKGQVGMGIGMMLHREVTDQLAAAQVAVRRAAGAASSFKSPLGRPRCRGRPADEPESALVAALDLGLVKLGINGSAYIDGTRGLDYAVGPLVDLAGIVQLLLPQLKPLARKAVTARSKGGTKK